MQKKKIEDILDSCQKYNVERLENSDARLDTLATANIVMGVSTQTYPFWHHCSEFEIFFKLERI